MSQPLSGSLYVFPKSVFCTNKMQLKPFNACCSRKSKLRFSHKTVVSFSPDFSLHVLCSGCLEEGLEALLKATGSNLLILKISHCPNLLTDRSLWLASCFCRALQAVTYRYATAHRQ